MIFSCLTPNPKGEHLKIIELRSPPLGARGSEDFSERTQGLFEKTEKPYFQCINLLCLHYSNLIRL